MISGVPQWSVRPCVNSLPDLCKWSTLSLTSTYADIFGDNTTTGTSSHSIDTLVETLTTDLQNVLSWCNSNNIMSLNVSKTILMYISSRHKQQTLTTCDHDISICDSKIQVSSVEKTLLVSQLVILSAGMLVLITLLKSVILIYSYCFYLEGTEYCFTTLTLYVILISIVLFGVTVVLHWKINL